MMSFSLNHTVLLRAMGLLIVWGCTWVPAGNAQIAVQSSLAQDRDVAPGAAYQEAVEIENTTDDPLEARLQLRDYHFAYDGTNAFNAPGTLPRSNASWIDLPQSTVTIPPKKTERVQYEVNVPEDVDGSPPTGTYWSILLIKPIVPGSAESSLSSSTQDPELGVRQVTRYGVQIATHIRTSSAPEIEVVQTNLTKRDEATQLVVDVKNAGTEMARPKLKLEVYNEKGQVSLRDSASPMRVYPSTSVRYRLPLSTLKSGTYEALVLVDTGGEQVTGVQYSLQL